MAASAHGGRVARVAGRARSTRRAPRERAAAPARAQGGDQSGKDVAGAGASAVSPGWLTSLQRNWGGQSDCPVADAQPEDIADLLGGALFLALFKWFKESGPVYLLPTGPLSSFIVISDPAAAKHVLRNYGTIYSKGLVREVSEFLFGDGFAISEGDLWKGRRRAVVPSLHRAYIDAMVSRVFGPSAEELNVKLAKAAAAGEPVDIEACFSQVTLDVIGKSVFNYDFGALTTDSPVIQAVYTALKETEQRSTDLLPIWKLPDPIPQLLSERQRKAADAVALIRKTTSDLIAQCRKIVEEENEVAEGEEYLNEADPSVLRFLLASRQECTETQLRDDLLSMLVAGHETTASVLTWTVYLLAKNPAAMEKAKAEVDEVMDSTGGTLTMADCMERLPYVMRCINESMRLYPHPPVLLRRADVEDELPGGYSVPAGQDILISVYNIHHSPEVWEDAEEFKPERFPLDQPVPNESNTDYAYIPFSGGARKCVGDQFALLEAQVILAHLLRGFDLELVPGREIGLTTGATIHTTTGLYVNVSPRGVKGAGAEAAPAPAPAVAAA